MPQDLSNLSDDELIALYKAKQREVTVYNNLQMCRKIALNSAYGACSNEWFMFFDMRLAEAITYAGQLAIKWVSRDLNAYLNNVIGTKDIDYVIANDTDSCYLNLGPLVEKVYSGEEPDSRKVAEFILNVCEKKINPLVVKSYESMREYTNAFQQRMSMKVESVSSTGMWKAKKRYALAVWREEGVWNTEPEVKVKGLEVVQSSTPEMCRDVMKKCVKLMLMDQKEELFRTIDAFEEKFRSSRFDEIGKTATTTDVGKFVNPSTIYAERTPYHVRGALVYNKLLKDKELTRTYQKIQNGDKVKICYLRMPNPTGQDVLSVFDRLPTEFGFEKYIDYDKQYEKVFLGPMSDLAGLVGWNLRSRTSISSFFG